MADTVQVIDTTKDADVPPTLDQQFEQQKKAGLHQDPTPATDVRPEWLPEKFQSPEDLAKAYAELEQKQSKPDDDTPKPDDKQDKPDDKPTDDTPKSPVEVAIAKASAEFEKAGDISSETVEELTKMGIDKAYIERYVEMAKAANKQAADRNEGQKGLSEDSIAEVMDIAGGKDSYLRMTEWIQDSLDETEVDAYNSAMDSQNLDLIRATVRGYHARFQTANPSEPTHLQGNTGSGPTVVPFQSVAQVQEAMSDPRYAKDPAYRAEVVKRIGASKVL